MLTRKERFERSLRCEEVDRLPFWVKIFGPSYRNLQQPQYRDMPELELVDALELDHMAGGPVPVRRHNDRVTERGERNNGDRTSWIDTPDGTLRQVDSFDAGSHSWHPTEYPVKTVGDLKALRHRYEHTRYEFDPDLVEKARQRLEQVGDRGIVSCGMGTSPLMELIQHVIGPDQVYFFLVDYPEEMAELIQIMHQDRRRHLRAVAEHSLYDYIMSGENTSTTLLSPALFEQYPWRHLNEYAGICAEHGKVHLLHMCGKLRELLPRIDELPSAAIEAYTSPTVGDTSIADRVRLCPHTAIIGGTNAALWMRPADEICATIESDLHEAGTMRGCVLTSAGVMPPAARIEKIAKVREFCKGLTWERIERN